MKQYIKPVLKSIGFIALFVLINTIIFIGYLASTGIEDLDKVSPNAIMGILIATQLTLFLFILFIYRKKKFLSLVRFEKTSPKILLWAFLIGLGGLNISGILIVVMQYLFPTQMAAYIEMIETSIGSANILLSLISVVILAPLVEEVVMRGMLFRWFEKTNIKPWALIILSGLCFGIWHLNLIQGVFTTVIGIVYALGFMMTKSLWVPLVMHFSNNAFAMAMGYLPDNILESHLFMILSYLMILLVPIGFIKIKKELMKIDSMEL